MLQRQEDSLPGWRILTIILPYILLTWSSPHQNSYRLIYSLKILPSRRQWGGQPCLFLGYKHCERRSSLVHCMRSGWGTVKDWHIDQASSPKRPKRLDDRASQHIYETPRDRYRQAYFLSFELAVGEIERRFNQSDLQLIKWIEELLLNAANGQSTDVTEDISKYLQPEVDCSWLSVQLAMIPNMISSVFSSHPITKVTNVWTIADAMNTSDIYKSMLCEVDKLLKIIFLTFPVTSATAEWLFSSLRRIKTFLRSSMSHCRLNSLFLLYIHVDKRDTLDLIQIAKEFLSVNACRVHYFGKF